MTVELHQTPLISLTTPITNFITQTMASAAEATGLCVFAISPTLLPMHRLLYYVSLLLSLLYPTPPPLIKGAFAYSLTSSAITALYSIILAIASRQAAAYPQNLDILPLWAMLSSAAISLPMFLTWNKNLHARSTGRPIVRIWGLLILIGTACAFFKLRKLHWLAEAIEGRHAVDQTWWRDATLGQCLTRDMPRTLRDIHTVRVMDPDILATDAFGRVWKVTPPMTFISLAIGALACIFSVPVRNKDAGALNGPEFTISDDLLDNRWSKVFDILRAVYVPLRMVIVGASPVMWIVVLVLNELFLLQKGAMALPRMEEVYEVGQWGIWAGLAFVVAAGAIDWFVGMGRVKAKFYSVGNETRVEYGGVGREL